MADAIKSRSQIKQVLADLRTFCVKLANTIREQGNTDPSIPLHMFSTQEYGGLALSGAEADRYSNIVSFLAWHMGEAGMRGERRT